MYRQGPQNILYSIGISPARIPANQEQAKQALSPVLKRLVSLENRAGEIPMLYNNIFLDLVYCKTRFLVYEIDISKVLKPSKQNSLVVSDNAMLRLSKCSFFMTC